MREKCTRRKVPVVRYTYEAMGNAGFEVFGRFRDHAKTTNLPVLESSLHHSESES